MTQCGICGFYPFPGCEADVLTSVSSSEATASPIEKSAVVTVFLVWTKRTSTKKLHQTPKESVNDNAWARNGISIISHEKFQRESLKIKMSHWAMFPWVSGHFLLCLSYLN